MTEILTRGACLSGWATEAYFGTEEYHKINFRNQQTVRVDLFLDILDGKIKPAPYSILQEVIARKDRLGVYRQTEDLLWLKAENPSSIIMDNYSELVDKRFENWQGWGFCGTYGDIDKEYLERDLAQYGLLAPESIFPLYDRFFQWTRDRYPSIPFVFIHFPTVLDPRERYKQQGEAIKVALETLAPTYNIQNIHPSSDSIQQIDGDYYHFGPKTVSSIVSQMHL